MKSEQINELATALAKAQGEMKPALFDKVNPHFKSKYASLASCWDAARVPLSKNGLSFVAMLVARDNTHYLVGTLLHSSGQYLDGAMHVSGTTPQQIGSSLSYATRYLLSALVGIVSCDDDDGEATREVKVLPNPRHRNNPPSGMSPVSSVIKSNPLGGVAGEYIMRSGSSNGVRIKNIPPNVLHSYVDNAKQIVSGGGHPHEAVAREFLRNVALFNGVTDEAALDAVERGDGGQE